MADSIQVWSPGTRFADANGNILAGGSIEFYAAGTTSPYTVYSDKDLAVPVGSIVYLDNGGAPVAEQGSSTKITVYVGTAPYKVVIKNSDGVVIETKDDVLGAFDTNAILDSLTIIAETVAETLTEATTLTSDDLATPLKNCNTTGGSFTVTLPDATATSSGARLGVRMAGTANAVTITTQGGQTIARSGVVGTTFSLSKLGETVWLVNDGGNWLVDSYVPPLANAVGVIAIADRLSAPPGGAVGGARYIITGSPTGAWSGYAQHDVVEADGAGGWFRYTPAEDCGWIAYVADENAYYWFVGSGWVQQTASSTVAGTVKVSTRAIMEAGAAADTAVLVGHQHFHPAHPKAWGYVTVSGGTPTLRSSYNVAGITDSGVGHLTVTLDQNMGSSLYAIVATASAGGGSNGAERLIHVFNHSAGSFSLISTKTDDSSSTEDPLAYHFAVFGELAP